MGTSRRTFLKLGGLAAFAIVAGGGIYRVTHGAPTRFVLNGEAKAAIDPAARAAALPGLTDRVHKAILGLPLTAQKEVQDLFGLLAIGPVRRFLAGVPDEWSRAKPEAVAAFLQDWRLHRLKDLQSGYHALHDLVIGSWYADPSTWAGIGYPGPIKELA
jgi:hypothetical protein